MKYLRAVLFLLLFSAPAVTQAAPILPGAPETVPLLYMCVDSACLNLSDRIQTITTPAGKLTYGVQDLLLTLGLGQIRLTTTYNPDPFVTFGVTTTNATAGPVTYSFLFATPIVPALYDTATSTGGVTVTNGSGPGGTGPGTVTVDNAPSFQTGYIQGYGTFGVIATNLGVDLGTAPCQAGPAPPATVTTTCNQGSLSNSFSPAVYNNLEALLTYTQEGQSSSVGWTGAVTLEPGREVPIPEPTHLVLYGLVALGYRLKRMRK